MREIDIGNISQFWLYIVMRLDLLVIASVSYDLIIGAPTLVEMRERIYMYHQIVTIRDHSKTEVLDFVHESETWDGSDDEPTTKSESDIGKDSDEVDYVAFLLTLREDQFPITEVQKIKVT